jgi:SAM-dependent methyltransferase
MKRYRDAPRRRGRLAGWVRKQWYRFKDLRTRLKKDAYTGRKGRILDVGCSSGKFLYRLREMGWETHGVEVDAGAAALAASRGLHVFHGALEQARYPREYFDVATVVHVLEHVHEPRTFLKEIWRVLKPGGKLYVEVPNLKSFNFRMFAKEWFHLDAPRHVCSYWRRPLFLALRDAGFRVCRLRYTSGSVGLRGSIHYYRRSRGLPRLERLERKGVRRLLEVFAFVLDAARAGDVIRVDALKPGGVSQPGLTRAQAAATPQLPPASADAYSKARTLPAPGPPCDGRQTPSAIFIRA